MLAFLSAALVAALFLWSVRKNLRLRPPTFSECARDAAASKSLYLGRKSYGAQALYVPWSDIKSSLSVVGDPGTGKSAFLMSLASVIAEQPRATLLFLDLKGGPEIAAHLRDIAARTGRPFRFVTEDVGESHACNPIATLAKVSATLPQFSANLAKALGVGEGLGHEFFTSRCKAAIRKLYENPAQPRGFTEMLTRILELDLSRHERETIEGVVDAVHELSTIEALNVVPGDPNVDAAVHEHAVDFETLFHESGIVYMKFSTLKGLARVALSEAFLAAKRVNTGNPEPIDVTIVVDEVAAILAEEPILGTIAAQGRSFQVRLVSTAQSLSQLEEPPGSTALAKRFCAGPLLYFGSSDLGRTNELLLQEVQDEVWVYQEREGFLRPRVNVSYRTEPRIRLRDLEALCHDARARGAFLARIPRSDAVSALEWGAIHYAIPKERYDQYVRSGYPTDLPGTVTNKPFPFDFGGPDEAGPTEPSPGPPKKPLLPEQKGQGDFLAKQIERARRGARKRGRSPRKRRGKAPCSERTSN